MGLKAVADSTLLSYVNVVGAWVRRVPPLTPVIFFLGRCSWQGYQKEVARGDYRYTWYSFVVLVEELAPDTADKINPPINMSVVDWKGFPARIDYPALTK